MREDTETRKYIHMINRHKSQITDLEIHLASQQVLIEDQQARIVELEQQIERAQSAARGKKENQ
jgi:uncharacterized coiled-coil protein SlyX